MGLLRKLHKRMKGIGSKPLRMGQKLAGKLPGGKKLQGAVGRLPGVSKISGRLGMSEGSSRGSRAARALASRPGGGGGKFSFGGAAKKKAGY